MFKYQLNQTVFTSEENFKEALEAVNNDIVSVDEVSALIDNQIIKLYNKLVDVYFKGKLINPNIVFDREHVEKLAYDMPDNEYAYFRILVNNGTIGVCGSGYTFECESITNKEILGKAQKAIDKGVQI